MRRKSERTASKKSKPSPEKKEKVEKAKHTRRRRKQSSSSASESAEDPPSVVESAEVVQTKAIEPSKSVKDDSSKESPEVWQVKSTETSGDVGEIQKLKLCLARPPLTPERADRSPSKRKHSRATSSSDTQSAEGEDKKKSKRRSRHGTKEDSHGDETELKNASPIKPSQSVEQSTSTDETPMSTTNDEKSDDVQPNDAKNEAEDTKFDNTTEDEPSKDTEVTDTEPSKDSEILKSSEATKDSKTNDLVKDVDASKDTVTSKEIEVPKDTDDFKSADASKDTECSKDADESKDIDASKDTQSRENDSAKDREASEDTKIKNKTSDNEVVTISLKSDVDKELKDNCYKRVSVRSGKSPVRKRSLSAEKSEILELHAEQTHYESSEVSFSESQDAKSKMLLDQDTDVSNFVPSEVSINKSTNEISGQPGSSCEDKITIDKTEEDKNNGKGSSPPVVSAHDDIKKDTPQHIEEHNVHNIPVVTNGEVAPLVINRKRRWGSRPSKFSTQKSITISTDVLKEIIPDVKPAEFDEVIEEKKHKRITVPEKIERPILPKIVIDNTDNMENYKKEKKIEDKDKENVKVKDTNLALTRKISIVKEQDSILTRPPSPPRHKQSSILYITNLVRPFTLPQLKNLLQRTGRIVDNGFWIDRIKSKCYVKYENEDQAVETRHALHGVTWPVSNPKTLHVDFSTQDDFDKAKSNEDVDNAQASTIPGTVEDWLREQDMKREKGELEKPWERKATMREWDVGKNEKTKEVGRPDKNHRDERPLEKRRHRIIEQSPEPARKFKKKEEEAPAKLLDDLFRKTKATPCIYWLPLSAETIAVKEEQRRQHMAEHERRLQELRRTHRRH